MLTVYGAIDGGFYPGCNRYFIIHVIDCAKSGRGTFTCPDTAGGFYEKDKISKVDGFDALLNLYRGRKHGHCCGS